METDVWKVHVKEALKFMEEHVGNEGTALVTETEADQFFTDKWLTVMAFRNFSSTLEEADAKACMRKLQAPVLTRWWTVGQGSHLAWKIWLLLLRITQSVINCHPTRAKQNKIASGLQPLLLEPDIFSNLVLIDCFHTAFFCPHLDWIQLATDMTNFSGFQAHNTLGRYFVMIQDLLTIKETMLTNHPGFQSFRGTLLNLTDSSSQEVKAWPAGSWTLQLPTSTSTFSDGVD
jgi:hypothetical protein